MAEEVFMVRADPRYSQMRAHIHALAMAWRTYWSVLALQARDRDRAASQRARLRAMTDKELIHASIQWGGAVTYPELRRRGLPLPQGASHA